MPSFSYLGRFRIGQWKEFRRFVLEERRDAQARIDVINQELLRIGEVKVQYLRRDDGEMSERRVQLWVANPRSSVGKLLQAYVGLGGNPWDVSMFLTPNSIVANDDGTLRFTQPSGGVLHAKSGQLAFSGTQYQQGVATLYKYDVTRVGGRRELNNEGDATQIARARRWLEPEIRYKRNALEERIIKLCDLREQLLQELELITCALAETESLTTVYSREGEQGPGYASTSSVASITNRFDGIIWTLDEELTAEGMPTRDQSVASNNFNNDAQSGLPSHIHIMSDAENGEEDGTAL